MRRSRGGIWACDTFKEESLTLMRSKFSNTLSVTVYRCRKRARRLSQEAARNIGAKKDFGIKVI
jgi:hypothetical protein